MIFPPNTHQQTIADPTTFDGNKFATRLNLNPDDVYMSGTTLVYPNTDLAEAAVAGNAADPGGSDAPDTVALTPIEAPSINKADLPAAAQSAGCMAFVPDATGGASMAVCDGVSWLKTPGGGAV
jgi:hypothetical protein